MQKITPDPPCFTLHDAAQRDAQSLDRAAADRALDHYLLIPKPPRPVGMPTYAIPDSVNLEAALVQASDLLRCAGASASLPASEKKRIFEMQQIEQRDKIAKA